MAIYNLPALLNCLRDGYSMKKLLSIITSMILLLSFVTGCNQNTVVSSSAADERSPAVTELIANTSGTVDLRVWTSEGEAEFISSQINDFVAKYSEIGFNITVEKMSDEDKYNNLKVDVIGAADVFTCTDRHIDELLAEGALSKIEREYTYNPAETNVRGSVTAALSDGIPVAYPRSIENGYFLLYDAAVYSEEDAESLDSMIVRAEETDTYISINVSDGWYLYGFFAGAGYTVNSDECDWDRAGSADVAQGIMDLYASGRVVDLSDSDSAIGISTGKVSALFTGMWRESSAEYYWGRNLRARELPTFNVGGDQFRVGAFAEYSYYGVNPYSQNHEWASVLAEYLSGYDCQLQLFALKGYVPTNNAVGDSEEVKEDKCAYALFCESNYADPIRVDESFWAISSEFGSALASGDLGGQSLQDYMYDVTDRILGIR